MIPPHQGNIQKQNAFSSVPQALERAFCFLVQDFRFNSVLLGLTLLFYGAIINL
jgi:hypothetical protein